MKKLRLMEWLLTPFICCCLCPVIVVGDAVNKKQKSKVRNA